MSEAKTSRRRFLAISATGAAALAGGLSVARAAHAAGAERLGVALIGAGGRGTGATADCLNAAKQIRLVAIADAFEDRARKSLELLNKHVPDQVDVPEERLFVGLDAYQKAIACEVDLVIHGAPPGFRPLHYQAAIEAGKHVFMEKPCCVDAGGYRTLTETNKLADRKGLKVGVGLYRRHHPAYLKQIRQIHDGRIGKILFMRCYCNMTAWGGFPKRHGMSELEYQLRNWRVFDWIGGGRLVEAHCHELDVMDWAVGDHPVEANGMGGRQVSTEARFGHDYDHHFHEYTYADGVKMYSQCRQMNGCWSPITEHVHGTEGVMDLSGKIMRINEYGRRETTNPYRKEHEDLLKAILDDKPYHEGWFGATSSFTAILGREASYSGKVVKWVELAEKGPALFPQDLDWDSDPPATPNRQGNYDHLVAVPGVYKAF
jgi:predicted dehydrogenase